MRHCTLAALCALLLVLVSACAVEGEELPETTPIPTPRVLDALRRNEEGLPLIEVYLLDADAIRTMDIESYVCGVLAGEMRSDWPMEALKAQAILARTFVLKFIEEKDSRYPGADISTDIAEAQAYNAEAVDAAIEQAVAETRGQVLLSADGSLPYTWFHAHSGGQTASAREGLGWRKAEPSYTRITRGLDSPDAPAEAAAWSAVFPVSTFLKGCRAVGIRLADAQQISIGQRGESGRALTLLVDGTPVPAPELRMALGSTVMRSTLLTEARRDGGVIRLSGKGYGHGVGMPQWGAYALAQDGMQAAEIATHYFDGLHVVTLWE